MSNDTERLEHEAEEHRSHLDSTLDELRSRMTIGQIVDEFSGYLKEGQGATMAQNFGRQVRDNPLALGLVGAGLAWLAAGPSVRSQGDRLRHDWEDREYDRFEEAFPPDGAEGAGYVPRTDRHPVEARPASGSPSLGATGSASGTATSGSSTSGSSGPGMADRAKAAGSSVAGAAGSARDRASGAASSTADAARHAGHSASHAAGSAAEAARRGSHDAADAFRSGSASAARGARHAGRGAYRAGQRAERGLIEALQDEPLVFGAIAVAVGAAIGAALPSTRREDELMGEARDRLRDEAWDRGRGVAPPCRARRRARLRGGERHGRREGSEAEVRRWRDAGAESRRCRPRRHGRGEGRGQDPDQGRGRQGRPVQQGRSGQEDRPLLRRFERCDGRSPPARRTHQAWHPSPQSPQSPPKGNVRARARP